MRSSSKTALLLLLLLLLVAPAAAQGTDVRQYLAFVHTANSDTGEVPATTVSVASPHTWNRTEGRSILELRASYIVQAGAATNPTATFRVLWDGVPLPQCTWNLQGGTITGGRFNPAVSLFCELQGFVLPGDHTVQVERTQVTGTPVASSTTSIVLHQRESVIMDLTVTSALDTWLPLLAVFGLFLFAFFFGLRKHPAWAFLLIVGFLGVLDHALGDALPPELNMPTEFVLVAAAVCFLLMFALGGFGFKNKELEKGT